MAASAGIAARHGHLMRAAGLAGEAFGAPHEDVVRRRPAFGLGILAWTALIMLLGAFLFIA